MISEVSKIRAVGQAYRDREAERWGRSVMADQANATRLCEEADGALFGNPPRRVFVPMFVRRGLDDAFVAAIREALETSQGAAFERLKTAVVELKVEMRHHLESERQAQATRWIGAITDDPFYPEIKDLIKPSPPAS